MAVAASTRWAASSFTWPTNSEPSAVKASAVIKTLTVIGAGQTTIYAPFIKAGGKVDLNGGMINCAGGMQQTAPSTFDLDGGTAVVAGTFLVTAGNVVGFGTLDGNLTLDGGTLDESMQFGPGTVFVTGNYIQTGAGSLILKVGDINGVPTNDVLAVSGSALLGGRLTVIEMGPVESGDTFQILVAGMGVTGTFLKPEGLPPLELPLYWLPVGYNSTSVILTVGTLTPPNPVPGGA